MYFTQTNQKEKVKNLAGKFKALSIFDKKQLIDFWQKEGRGGAEFNALAALIYKLYELNSAV